MEKRRLGRTGHMSTVVIFGAAALWRIDQEGANAALDLALAHGVNHIDVAPRYGVAEERLGPWLGAYRDRFFLGCKTLERTRDGAWDDLRRSLQRLRTDRLDLYQLHAVGTFEELDKALAPGGAIETLVEAREQGLTRYLGITGHGVQTPAVHAAALERFDFDTVMLPLYPALYALPEYRRDMARLLQTAEQRDVGVMIIKSVARQPWPEGEKRYNTWYEPFDTPEAIARGVRFALSQPVTAIVSAGDVHLLPMILDAAEHFQPMETAEQEAVIADAATWEPVFAPPA